MQQPNSLPRASPAFSIRGARWYRDGRVTYAQAPAEGLLLNVRMVNAVFEDRRRPRFDPQANTDRFIRAIPDYAAHGVLAFTLCLQGGMPGYEGAINSGFTPNGGLRKAYLQRVAGVIEACRAAGCAVILGCFYQRQSQHLRSWSAVQAGVSNLAGWIRQQGYRNVLLEIANEYAHGGYAHSAMKQPGAQLDLIARARAAAPDLLVSTSGMGTGHYPDELAAAVDFLLVHFNTIRREEIPIRIKALKRWGKPIVCNEDIKTGAAGVKAVQRCVREGISWGLMHVACNQQFPFAFDGAADDPVLYAALRRLAGRKSRLAR